MTAIKKTWVAGNTGHVAEHNEIAYRLYNVKDYGAVGDGASHPLSTVYGSLAAAKAVFPHVTALTQELDWAAIQLVLDHIKANGSNENKLFIPAGTYELGTDTCQYASATRTLSMEGEGEKNSVLEGSGNILLDIVGSSGNQYRRFGLNGLAGANVGILLGRVDALVHCSRNLFEGVETTGEFAKAAVYNICAEVNTWLSCSINNKAAAPGAFAFYTSTENDLAVTTTAGTLKESVDSATNVSCWFLGGQIFNMGGGVALGIFGNTRTWQFTTYLASNYRTVFIDKSSTQAEVNGPISFRDCQMEGTGATLVYLNDATIYNLSLESCCLYATNPESGFTIYQASVNKALQNLSIRHVNVNPWDCSLDIVYYSDLGELPALTIRTASDYNRFHNMTPTLAGTSKGDVVFNDAGLVLPQYTAADRGAMTPSLGSVIVNADTKKLNFWNGTGWEVLTSSV